MIPADWIDFTTSDGLLTLRLPPHWEQEDEEDDGTTAFGADDEDAGVLRVTPMVYEKEAEVGPKELPRLLAKRGAQPIRVRDGRYVRQRTEEDEEDGEPLIQHTWEMIEQTGPREVVILIATYTFGTQETLASAQPFLAQLDASLKACQFDTSEEEDEEEEADDDEIPS
ncbi:MAG: hypothetical protein ACO1SV_17085 [Fimbriimonas sp.]